MNILNRQIICALFTMSVPLFAQAPEKTEPDTLLLNDGEKLIGHLVEATGGSVRFKSDVLGEVTIGWSKIKEFHSAAKFAVITKDVKLGRKAVSGDVPQGTVSMTDQKIEVGTKTIPVADAAHVIDVPAFETAFEGHPNIIKDWKGTATAGASLVESTQKSRTYTAAISLVRTIPEGDWLPRRNRTSLDYTTSYGVLSQPGTPKVKTSIYHADLERDEYFSASAYAFGQALFDHNFSQGLDLQQTYVGGIGWTVIKRANETLDLKGGFSYIKQQFADAGQSQNLASSVFDEKYLRKFARGMTFTQEITVSPAWNNTRALSAAGSANLAIPVYKRFAFTLGVIDNFLNDPPPEFKRNSFQFVTGLTYVLP